MADIVALEWDRDEIIGIAAAIRGARVRVRRYFMLPIPRDLDEAARAAWLKEQLAQHGVSGGTAIAVLPRNEAVLRRIDLPDVPDDELPNLVRFQAAAKSSVPVDELALDFLPLPKVGETPGRSVLTVSVPRERTLAAQQACEGVGLELKSLGLVPLSIAELVARDRARTAPAEGDRPGADMVISHHGPRVELAVLVDQSLVFSHWTRIFPDEETDTDQQIISEATRALVAVRGWHAGLQLGRVCLLAERNEGTRLAAGLTGKLGCPVVMLDPLTMVDWECEPASGAQAMRLAGVIGALLARQQAHALTIDFLAPRRPAVKKNPRRRQFTILAAGAAFALLVAIIGYWFKLGDLDRSLRMARDEEQRLKTSLQRGDPVAKSAGLVQTWLDGQVHWLDELQALNSRLPGTDRIYLTSLRLDPVTGNDRGRIKLEGFARQQGDVMSLNQHLLAEQDRYQVQPHSTQTVTGDPFYPWKFESELLLKRPTKQPAPAKSGPAKK